MYEHKNQNLNKHVIEAENSLENCTILKFNSLNYFYHNSI